MKRLIIGAILATSLLFTLAWRPMGNLDLTLWLGMGTSMKGSLLIEADSGFIMIDASGGFINLE